MLEWKIKYYNGTLILDEINSNEISWINTPIDNVIEVIIIKDSKTHTLRGFDNYWIDGYKYGAFNNNDSLEEHTRIENGHQETIYEGEQYIIFDWENEHIKLEENINLIDIHIIKGIMIPDEEAEILGLI